MLSSTWMKFIESRDLSLSLLCPQPWSCGLITVGFIWLSGHISVCPSVCPSVYFSSVCSFSSLSIYLSISKMAWPCGVLANLFLQSDCGKTLLSALSFTTSLLSCFWVFFFLVAPFFISSPITNYNKLFLITSFCFPCQGSVLELQRNLFSQLILDEWMINTKGRSPSFQW